MKQTKTIANVPAATNITTNTLILSANDSGGVNSISYSALLAKLRADLLGGIGATEISRLCYKFPDFSQLQAEGLQDANTSFEAYFKGLLKFMADKKGIFIGEMRPNVTGFGMLQIVTGAAYGEMPKFALGFYLGYGDNNIKKFTIFNSSFSLREI